MFETRLFAYPQGMATLQNHVQRFWGVRGLAATLLLIGVSGCNGEEHKKQLADLQRKADERVATIERQSKERIDTIEKQLEAMKAEVLDAASKAKAQVDDVVSKAQANVEDAEKVTSAAVHKAREAYKSEAKVRLASLNQELATVTAGAHKVPAKAKAAYDKAIKNVLALQKDIAKDIAAYDQATLDTFAKTKAKLDQDLAKYKAAIKAAKSKVPG
jgi:hypothetical protein